MASNTALYQSILQNPDDDAVRLIYADWLEENGDPPRAEFIRAQIYLSTMDRAEPQFEELQLRVAALLQANRSKWEEEVPRWARDHVDFKRGFVEQIRCTAKDWIRGAKGLWREVPVRSLHLARASSGLDALLGHTTMTRLRGLQFDPEYIPPAVTRPFFSSESLIHLRSLTLSGCDLREWALRQLAESPHLTHLVTLKLSHNHIRDAGIERLSTAASLGRLAHLDLGMNEVGATGAGDLAQSPLAEHLEHLDLSMNRLGDAGVEELTCGRMPCLKWLMLGNNQLLGIEPLAEWESLSNVVGLDLHANPLGAAGFRTLARSPHLRALRWLDLHENQIEPDWFEVVRDSTLLDHLTTLNLGANQLGDKGVSILAQSSHLRTLTRLDVSNNGVTPEGLRALMEAEVWQKLRFVDFASNTLGDEGARLLLESLPNTRIMRMDLSECGVSEPMQQALQERFGGAIQFGRPRSAARRG